MKKGKWVLLAIILLTMVVMLMSAGNGTAASHETVKIGWLEGRMNKR